MEEKPKNLDDIYQELKEILNLARITKDHNEKQLYWITEEFKKSNKLKEDKEIRIFNQILEYSGLSPIDFGNFKAPQLQTKLPIPQASLVKEMV